MRWNRIGESEKKNMKWGDRSQLQGGMLMLEAPTPAVIAQKGKQGKQRIPAVTGPDSSFDVPGSSTGQVNGMIIPKTGDTMLQTSLLHGIDFLCI